MAFASTITDQGICGNRKVTWGTWTTDTTGGNIDTGLNLVEFMKLQTSGASVSADESAVNETLPFNGHAITIVCTSDADGYWWAFGY